jgi:hypothetical protein
MVDSNNLARIRYARVTRQALLAPSVNGLSAVRAQAVRLVRPCCRIAGSALGILLSPCCHHVQRLVFLLSHYLKVFYSVVGLNPIEVVNNFVRGQHPPKELFHHISVLSNSAVTDTHFDVPVCVNPFASSKSRCPHSHPALVEALFAAIHRITIVKLAYSNHERGRALFAYPLHRAAIT